MPHKFNRFRIIERKTSMIFFFLWGIDDFFVCICSSIITIDEQSERGKYTYLFTRSCCYITIYWYFAFPLRSYPLMTLASQRPSFLFVIFSPLRAITVLLSDVNFDCEFNAHLLYLKKFTKINHQI